jgi:ABC-type sugar transport system substrate-binding protein
MSAQSTPEAGPPAPKRRVSNGVIAAIVVVVVLIIAGTAYYLVTRSSTPAGPTYQLALVMPNLAFGGGWYGRVSAGFHDALNQSKWAQQNVNLVFETITANSPSDEVTAMQAAQTKGANLIGLASLDQNALVPSVVAASKGGANVFTFGLSLNGTLLTAQGGQIITDVELQNLREGVEVTNWLVIYLQTHPQFTSPYSIFVHDLSPAASAGYDRLVGVKQVLDPLVAKGILNYTVGPFDNDLTVATAYNQMKSYLATSPPLTAVLALQDVISVGDIKALKEANLLNNPVIVVGSDCIPMGVDALKAGDMTASAVNPGYPIGFWAGQAIVLWAKYHSDPSFTAPPKQLFIWQGIATPSDMSLISQTPPLPWTPVPGYTPGDYGSLAIGLAHSFLLAGLQTAPARRTAA